MPEEPEQPHRDDGLDLARSLTRATSRATPASRARSRRPGRSGGAAGGPTQRVSGAHPDERDPQLLGSSVDRLIEEHGWSWELRVTSVFERWGQLVGEDIGAHSRPESFVDGVVRVRTDSTAWATQLRLLAPAIVRRLCEELGDATVTAIDVQGPHGPSWKKGPRSVRDGRGPRDTYG